MNKCLDRVEFYDAKSLRIGEVIEAENMPGSSLDENERDMVVVLVQRAVKEVAGPTEWLGWQQSRRGRSPRQCLDDLREWIVYAPDKHTVGTTS